MDNVLIDHNISKLFSDAGLSVESKRYRSDLDYLTECIKWRGRYPLPTEAKYIGGSIIYHPQETGVKGFVTIIPIDTIHEFVEMARKNLEYIIEKGKGETC